MGRGDLPVSRHARLYIAGHRGLVGSALWRHFEELGFDNLIGRSSSELDLRDSTATREFFDEARPEIVIDAAARVGGIWANLSEPANFISDNLRIQVNLLDSAVATGVSKFLFLASSCIYPKQSPQPIREEALLTGPLEPTSQAYAIAKIAGIHHVTAIRRQHGLPYISVMPTNVYGPGDNFHPDRGHVMAAMIRRFHDAARDDAQSVTCWGTGRPRREFIHAQDLAEACHVLLDRYDDDSPVNVGVGRDLSISELATLVASAAGYDGEIRWDHSKPDGTPAKFLDTRRLDNLGWKPKISLTEGIAQTYQWYRVLHQDDGC